MQLASTNKAAILDRLGNHTTTENATNFLQYENSTYGIKMQYPSDWRVEGASNSSIVESFYPQINNALCHGRYTESNYELYTGSIS